MVLAVAAGLVLSQRAKAPEQPTSSAAKPAAQRGPAYSVPAPPDSDDTQFVVAPQAGDSRQSELTPEPQCERRGASTQHPARRRTANAAAAAPAAHRRRSTARAQCAGQPCPMAPCAAALDRVIQLANAGNPIALTILGLRALDGTGVSRSTCPTR